MPRSMSPEHAEFWLQDVLLGTLKTESRTTKSVVQAVPAERAEYRPDAISKTANDLVRHIAAAEIRFLDTTINAEFSTTSSLPESAKTPQEVADWYEKSFAERFEKLAQLKGEHLVKITDFRGMFQMPAVSFLQLGLSHSIHHRGQLTSYLRSMGAKVPSIYGESYDAAEERKAKSARSTPA